VSKLCHNWYGKLSKFSFLLCLKDFQKNWHTFDTKMKKPVARIPEQPLVVFVARRILGKEEELRVKS
jgi:hypothetical protein